MGVLDFLHDLILAVNEFHNHFCRYEEVAESEEKGEYGKYDGAKYRKYPAAHCDCPNKPKRKTDYFDDTKAERSVGCGVNCVVLFFVYGGQSIRPWIFRYLFKEVDLGFGFQLAEESS